MSFGGSWFRAAHPWSLWCGFGASHSCPYFQSQNLIGRFLTASGCTFRRWHINEHHGGCLAAFFKELSSKGLSALAAAYPSPSFTGLSYILGFGALQAALQVLLPGQNFYGPPTPRGNVPVYKSNGVLAYCVTIALFLLGWRTGAFDPGAVYDALGSMISTSNVFSLAFCAVLCVKGRHAPSSTDAGTTGSLLFDFYWGTELFPRFGPLDVKTWTNCRMGMMGWAVLTLCYAAKQAQTIGGGVPSPSMLACVGLMQLYVLKFFMWEEGYWSSMDIAHDRAGFYLVWGCLVWVPSVYTSPAMYLVRRPGPLSPQAAAAVFLFGAVMVWMNYDADRQRQHFRRSGGKALVWGRVPRKIHARYVTGDGCVKDSLLLASGWWGLARHFHYLPELAAAAAWSCPCGFASPLPYVYLAFLTALLTDRAFRDDERCRAKYCLYWEKYCEMVPYRIVPYVF